MSKTHVIDGKTYVEVCRKAKVGEKIVMIDGPDRGYQNGDVFEITNVLFNGVNFLDSDKFGRFAHDGENRYRVLEPVESPQLNNNQLLELIANLSRRVHSLESQLRDTQRNVERQGVEIANIETATKAPQSGAKLLAEAFEALAKYERCVGYK